MNRFFETTLLLLLAMTTFAAPVSKQKTARIAQAYFYERGGHDTLTEVTTEFQNLRIYVGAKGKGFVIMSSDDAATPFLAYSVNNPFSTENMPANIAYWLQNYDDQISYIQDNNLEPSTAIRNEWHQASRMSVSKARLMPAPAILRTDNLLTTTWAQGNYYNDMCPYDTKSGQKSAVGCVATAMGQIMRYWRFPQNGIGSNTYSDSLGSHTADFSTANYDWTNMPDALNSSSTATQVGAVSKLLYHVGVAVNMKYSAAGSGAQTTGNGKIDTKSAENAYRLYFKYLHTVHSIFRINHTDSAWVALLKNEINHGRPVQYGASGNDHGGDGHSFVCCGYDNTGKFYFNWGWAGSNDGDYYIGALNPGSDRYNWYNKAVIGIQPDSVGSASTVVTLSNNNQNAGVETGAGTYVSYRDTVRLNAYPNKGYLFDNWDGTNTFIGYNFIANGGNVSHQANYSRLGGDTIGYCYLNNSNTWGSKQVSVHYWGIKIDTAQLRNGRNLDCVRFFSTRSSLYMIHIFNGGDTVPQNEVLVDTVFTTSENSWNSFYLSSPVAVNSSQPMWIVFECDTVDYPMTSSFYRGNKNGSWHSFNKVKWGDYSRLINSDIAWQIIGVFCDPNGPFTLDVTSNNTALGTVTGGGKYNNGDIATLIATAKPGAVFSQWSDGVKSSTRNVTVNRNASYQAIFEEEITGVDNVNACQYTIVADDAAIIVKGAEGATIMVFDAQGKLVAMRENASSLERITMALGVYFVRINATTNKIIVK